MARKKEIILQEVLNTPQLWDDAMEKEKLYVVDVHQKWCGPCKAITGMLRRIKNELGDDYLCFAVAEADSLPSLESYRGKCEPMFLFFGCGQLVAYVRGCNAPLLQETIMSTLEHEHKILEGQAERKVIKDTQEPEEAEAEKGEEESEEEGEIIARKQITVALIKPDVVANGQVEEILEKINEVGIEVLVNEEKQLTEDEAKSFYQNKTDEEYFEELIAYVTSGPCRVLVLTKSGSGEGVVEQWRDIIGPFDAAVAKEENPESLRAIYGTDAKANALHGSSSQDEAARELGFFFPEFEPPTYRAASAAPSGRSRASARSRKSARKQKQLQRTLAIIRPDALSRHRDAIMEKIAEAGFEISMMKEMTLTEDQAKAFYKEHEDQPYFEKLVSQMTSGPVLALCLAHSDAIQKWRDMLGPKIPEEALEQQPESLRAQFHVEDADVNMLHGSDSEATAVEELKGIFDIQQSLAVIKPDAIEQKDAIIEKLKEAGFMISCQKDMNLTREIAGEIYKTKEGTEFYDDLIGHMTSGPTLMMVLSCEDAVHRLRTMMGPTDPDEAKQSAPDSLRALFAKSILENAIHAPSNTESTKEKIKFIFGDIEFNWDGTVKGGDDDVIEEATQEEEAAEAEEQKPEEEGAPAEGEEEKKDEEKKEDAEPAAAAEGEDEAKPAEEEAPAEEAPTEEAPTEEAPAEEAPTEEAPAEEAPQDEPGEGEGESELVSDRQEKEGGTDETETPPKTEGESPQKSDAPTKTGEDNPEKIDDTPQKSEDVSPEKSDTPPKTEEKSPEKSDAIPKTEGETPAKSEGDGDSVSVHSGKNDTETGQGDAPLQKTSVEGGQNEPAPPSSESGRASVAGSEKPTEEAPAIVEKSSRPVSARSAASSKHDSRAESSNSDSVKHSEHDSRSASRNSDKNTLKTDDGDTASPNVGEGEKEQAKETK